MTSFVLHVPKYQHIEPNAHKTSFLQVTEHVLQSFLRLTDLQTHEKTCEFEQNPRVPQDSKVGTSALQICFCFLWTDSTNTRKMNERT